MSRRRDPSSYLFKKQGPTLQIWDGDELIKTVLQANAKEIRKKRAAKAS